MAVTMKLRKEKCRLYFGILINKQQEQKKNEKKKDLGICILCSIVECRIVDTTKKIETDLIFLRKTLKHQIERKQKGNSLTQ